MRVRSRGSGGRVATDVSRTVPDHLLLARGVAAGVTSCFAIAAVRHLAAGSPLGDLRDWVIGIVTVMLGLRVTAHAPRNPIGWLLMAMAVSASWTVLLTAWPTVHLTAWAATWTWIPAYTLLPTIGLIVPTGRPLSRGWVPLLVASVVATLAVIAGVASASWDAPMTFWVDAGTGVVTRGAATVMIAAGLLLAALSGLAAVVSLALRWRHAHDRRPMVAWFVGCAALTAVAAVLEFLGAPLAWWLVALALPTATLVAVVRYGLFDIDLVIHRSLLYGWLSVALVALHGAATLAVADTAPDLAQDAAVVITVLAVLPLHRLCRRRLDQWLHGDRGNPYGALSRLGQRLADSLTPNEVLPTVATEVALALKSPYVAVRLDTHSGRGSVEVGRRRGWPLLVVPLSFQGRRTGELVVEARAADEAYGARERRLVEDLAHSAAPAARAVVLLEELQVARERLVLAREEERRRLRRDLHDGVGAALAGVGMQVHAAARTLEADPQQAATLLASATEDLRESSRDVRRLVDGLRPAALDQGLHDALRAYARRSAGSEFSVDLRLPATVPQIPAAVEVAAFHVIGEAVTNAVRHSGGTHCLVDVKYGTDALEIVVSDDGCPDAVNEERTSAGEREGVGLHSMQERCAELGGWVHVVRQPNGTVVRATLPLPRASATVPVTQRGPALTDGAVVSSSRPVVATDVVTGEGSRLRALGGGAVTS